MNNVMLPCAVRKPPALLASQCRSPGSDDWMGGGEKGNAAVEIGIEPCISERPGGVLLGVVRYGVMVRALGLR